jgi:hypothetical protein
MEIGNVLAVALAKLVNVVERRLGIVARGAEFREVLRRRSSKRHATAHSCVRRHHTSVCDESRVAR